MLAVKDDKIAYFGPRRSLENFPQERIIDCRGKIVTPGLIDCHTHTIFGGDRADEFSLRAAGASYEELLARGGGIHNTVARVQRPSKSCIAARSDWRSWRIWRTTVADWLWLDLKNELKMLHVLNHSRSNNHHVLEPVSLPACREYAGNPSGYLDLLPTRSCQGLQRAKWSHSSMFLSKIMLLT